ncbi:hypothetical protein T12_3583 [Trichinella patagoniensis]|uniref:Uncharacterized protein n=1 Tax=Trichinella patagoniensis TaxID=990121 RepID=A0A0V1AHT2_9BILA|nr:hypothetical protein T12_3583 [Trichinella patagoniensis]
MFLGAYHDLFQCHEFAKQERGFTEASDVLDFPTPGVYVVSALDQDSAYRITGFLLPPGATDKYRNEPLPQAGSFTSSTALLAHSSLNGGGPVLTGGFPFLSDSRFPDSIITIQQQSVSIVFIGNCEQGPPTMRYNKLLRPTQQPDAYVHPALQYSTSDLQLGPRPLQYKGLSDEAFWPQRKQISGQTAAYGWICSQTSLSKMPTDICLLLSNASFKDTQQLAAHADCYGCR